MKKAVFIIIAISVILAGYYFLIHRRGSGKPADESTQITAVATQGDLVVSINSNGKVTPVQTVEVKSKASGEIIEMNVEVGDFITRGKLICRLDTTTVVNDYLQAEADYNVARTTVKKRENEFRRQNALFQQKLISEQSLDDAELLLEQAKSSLVRAEAAFSTAQERLRETEVRSPIDGIVLRKLVEQGQIISSGVSNVSGGTTIVQVAQMDSVYVVADVDETDIGKVEIGQKVKVTADSYPDKIFEGRVMKIAPIAKTEQNVTVFEVTTLIDNSSRLLKAGMNCSIEVITAEAYDVVLVPNDAVRDPSTFGLPGDFAALPNPGPPQGDSLPAGKPDRAQMAERVKNMSPEQIEQMRQRFAARHEQFQKGNNQRKVVVVKRNGEFMPQMVSIGKSNLDYTEIISGIAVGDTIDATPSSLMMKQRAEWRERMMQMSGSMSGLRKTN